MRHVTNLVTLEQILKLLLNSCFSPPQQKSLKKKDASKEEVAKVVDWDLCGFGPTADCCVTWVRHRLLSATWNIMVQLSSLNQVCTESICWQFGTKTLVALSSWKRVLLCSTGWIGTHHKAQIGLKFVSVHPLSLPSAGLVGSKVCPSPQSSLFPGEWINKQMSYVERSECRGRILDSVSFPQNWLPQPSYWVFTYACFS